jgi:predicted Zn-dependent protease
MTTLIIDREDAEGIRIQIAAQRSLLWLMFAIAWSLGWMLLTAMGVFESWQQFSGGSVSVLYPVLGLTAWMAAGAVAVRALSWMVAGRPETIIVSAEHLILMRGRGRLGRTDHFPVAAITNVRLLPVLTFQSLAALLGFWGTGRGRVGIDLARITYRCGSGLTKHDAERLVDHLRRRLNVPEADTDPVHGNRLRPVVVPGRALGWVANLVMLHAFVVGILFPANALAMDFSTCTAGQFRPAYQPLDMRGLVRNGIVYFVPFDDFPLPTAQSLAVHYQTKYQVPVQVGPTLRIPESAADPARGQLNSSALLAILEEHYPSTSGRTVIVGLTQYDMYIPDVSWEYAFSNRGADRLAVVSTARMEYGCLGFTTAGPDQQLARVRKMVGKNLGVLYFRLGQSRNPGSMLYGDIGGVQELDRMTDDF